VSAPGTPALSRRGDHAVIRVRVQPGAAREGISGLRGDRIRVSVHARPHDGAANRDLLRLLARALRVSPSRLTILSGERAREKDILVAADLSENDIISRLGLAGT